MLAHLALGLAPPEVALLEVVHIGRMNGPVVALAVRTTSRLHEAVVQRQIVANGVAPAGSAGPEVRIVVEDVLVDVGEDELLVDGAEDGHGDQADVAVLGLGFLGLKHAG